jgi:hypothetical protein
LIKALKIDLKRRIINTADDLGRRRYAYAPKGHKPVAMPLCGIGGIDRRVEDALTEAVRTL